MKSTGHVKRLVLNLEHPKMEIDIEYNNINLFVGKNGVGKSLMLKLVWVMTTHAATSLALGLKEPQRIKQLQWTFDHSLDNFDFTGDITVIADKGEFSTTITKGEVLSSKMKVQKGVTRATPSMFLSKKTRQFTAFSQYLKLKDKCTKEDEILEFFKLYDIAFMETWLIKAKTGRFETFPESLMGVFDSMINEDKVEEKKIVGIQIEGNNILYRTKDGNKNLVTTLGAGEQALLIMFTSQF